MINTILKTISDVSLTKTIGRFLADKSYAFDTVFFLSKFILHNSQNNRFNKQALKEKAIKYTEDIFQLTPGTAGAVNYFLETSNLLEFANIIQKTDNNLYKINHRDILEFISETPENAYIFNYLIAYLTFKNDSLLDLFYSYSYENSILNKSNIANQIYEKFCDKSISIHTINSQWSKQLVKYSLTVLGFINEQHEITRDLIVKDIKLKIDDIAINVAGTRTPIYLPKKNDYLQTFNTNYVKSLLKPYIILSTYNLDILNNDITDSIAKSLAELKLTMLDDQADGIILDDLKKEQYIVNTIRIRNQSIQHQFRKGLLDNNEHKCPICGFCFEEFLIASHIKPYSKCDDTYDAINHYNGLLLCPNHDRLFEGAEHMTIDAITGKIILSPSAKASKDFGVLNEKYISKIYIENERRHYLKWHNEKFHSLHK